MSTSTRAYLLNIKKNLEKLKQILHISTNWTPVQKNVERDRAIRQIEINLQLLLMEDKKAEIIKELEKDEIPVPSPKKEEPVEIK